MFITVRILHTHWRYLLVITSWLPLRTGKTFSLIDLWRLSLWLLLRSCNTSAIVFVTSVKILQYIGDCLCDVWLELAKHSPVDLCGDVFVTSIKILQYIGDCLCDVFWDLAIHRRLSLWRLLRTCKTSANYIGCEFCWELAKHSQWLTCVVMSLWLL